MSDFRFPALFYQTQWQRVSRQISKPGSQQFAYNDNSRRSQVPNEKARR